MNKKRGFPSDLVLGLDTGGTYTDAVLLDYRTRSVVAAHKCLTTRRDLRIGIEEVIKGIRIQDPAQIKLISISTTLATNAIAENKGKSAALFLIGYDPELISAFRLQGHFVTPDYYYFTGGHDLYGREQTDLDLRGILAKADAIRNRVDAIAVSSYFSPLNPEHEDRIREAICDRWDIPVVLGHQLSNHLGSVERATTATLNASLLAVVEDFAAAARAALQRRGVDVPLMIVRGDGTMMRDESALGKPIETIHSGPAASAIGARFLSGCRNALVIDVGGTTTDIALIDQGLVAVKEKGATVNGHQTAVKAADICTIALGGDSHIKVSQEGKITIGPERVVPLANLARQYPRIKERLKLLGSQTGPPAAIDWLEYWFILRKPGHDHPGRTNREKALLEFLQAGPRPLPEILKYFRRLHSVQLGAGNLLRQEIVAKGGLTPTDLLHAEGTFAPWDTEAAQLALEILCRLHFNKQENFQRRVWSRITETIVRSILTFLTQKEFPPPALPDKDLGRWFFKNSLYATHPQLRTSFQLRIPIIGIGAPAKIFLENVAAILKTELILPENYEVANAIGAVAGSVMCSEEVLIYPRRSKEGLEILGYRVQSREERQEFLEIAEALAYARGLSREKALHAALDAGAANPQIQLKEWSDGLDFYRVQARAMGSPSLGNLDQKAGSGVLQYRNEINREKSACRLKPSGRTSSPSKPLV